MPYIMMIVENSLKFCITSREMHTDIFFCHLHAKVISTFV